MGCYGYICPKCKTAVRGSELCVLRHVRHGELIGETQGHYDEYGGVTEDDIFNGQEGPNSAREIGKSCFDFNDSEYKVFNRRYCNGELVDYSMFALDWHLEHLGKYESWEERAEETEREWYKLKENDTKPMSGVSAYHKYCFDRLTDEEKKECVISRSDPDQSWGKPRKKYM